jgi:hypothetical protein
MGEPSMRDLVIAVGGPLRAGENRKAWLARVAGLAGLSERVARAAWHGETQSRRAAQKLKEAAGKYEAEQLATRFDGLASALALRDADFHCEDVLALVDAARALRGLHRPRDSGG